MSKLIRIRRLAHVVRMREEEIYRLTPFKYDNYRKTQGRTISRWMLKRI
jgi:hypothetical protein